jgi:hypothetical protein
MNLPIGNVYQQSARDERSTQWGPFNFLKAKAEAAQVITVGGPPDEDNPWDPPAGYVAHIRTAQLRAEPTTGDSIQQAMLSVVDAGGLDLLMLLQLQDPLAIDLQIQETIDLNVLLLPRHFLKWTVAFSDTTTNIVGLSAQAILMPQGNVAAF